MSGSVESIIAAVLAGHAKEGSGLSVNSPDTCRCGAKSMPERGEEEASIRRDRAFAAHQAAAVLAALQEAGTVEVVTGYGVELRSGDVERMGTNLLDAKDWLEDFTGGDDPEHEPLKVVSRTTTTIRVRTNWAAVAG